MNAMNNTEPQENTFPAARKHLDRVREAEKRVERLEMQIENLRLLLTEKAVHLEKTGRNETPDPQRDATILAEIDEKERELQEAEGDLETVRLEVGMTICRLSDPIYQKVLIHYYLDHMSWEAIAGILEYSRIHIYRLRNGAMAEFEEIVENMAEASFTTADSVI